MQDLNLEIFNYQNSLILSYMPLVFRCLSATEPFGVFPETRIADLLPVSDSGRLGWSPRMCISNKFSHDASAGSERVLSESLCCVAVPLRLRRRKEKAGSLHHHLTGRWLVFKKQSQQSQCLNLGPGSYLQHVCPSFYLNILPRKMEIRITPISSGSCET